MPEESLPGNLPEFLEDAEERAKQDMQRQLGGHLNLTLLTTDTIAFVLDQSPILPLAGVGPSRNVVTMLLVRISNDIRAAGLLAWHGYALQAASLIANCHESAFAVGLIGSDDGIAQKWIDHDDPTTVPFGKIKDLTRKALQNLNVPDVEGQTTTEYTIYRQLCWAKHANPLLQKLYGFEVQEGRVVLSNGPDTSEQSIRVGCYALEHSAHLAYLALCSYIDNHLKSCPNHIMDIIGKRLATLGAEKHSLSESSMSRWGNTDPFPGKWKTQSKAQGTLSSHPRSIRRFRCLRAGERSKTWSSTR